MAGLFEIAPTGRSRCRGCSQPIAKAEVRFGERVPNPFAEGETTLWFHPRCAAYKLPASLMQSLREASVDIPERERLELAARSSLAHRRLSRIDGAERARRSQARCRSCREPIERDTWRIRLVFYEDGRFDPGGFVHLNCRTAYFERGDLLEHVLQFSPLLSEDERAGLARAFDEPAIPRSGQ